MDTFFFLSAFLGAYIFLVKAPAELTPRSLITVPIAYFHRYYRLTPLLAFVMYFFAFVVYPMASGPGRTILSNYTMKNCESYGWANLLYINNFYPDLGESCFG